MSAFNGSIDTSSKHVFIYCFVVFSLFIFFLLPGPAVPPMMDDQVCPRCKTTKYRNPSLKLLVNVCGHTLCESCVDLLFLKGLCLCIRYYWHELIFIFFLPGAGSCPECNVPLRRSNFRVQLFEDPMVEKEVDIRRRILRDYNKKVERHTCAANTL